MKHPYKFEHGGHTYAGAPLSVLAALDVARRFTPVLSLLAQRARTKEDAPSDAALARGLVAASAGVPGEDYTFVLATCLRSLQRVDVQSQQGQPVWGGGGLMFQDFEPMDLVIVLYKVLEANGLVDFFFDPPKPSGEPPLE